MPYQIMYSSQATKPMTMTGLEAILADARAGNQARNVTGVLVYVDGVFFQIIGRDTWWIGALLGAVHAVFTATIVVNVLLPIVHPRMATTETAANETTLIEPPGFLMLNYGRSTFFVSLVAHIAYGTVVALIV